MLLILIGITWLAVVALFVAICRTAAEGDRSVAAGELESVSIGPKLLLARSPKRQRPLRRRQDAHRHQDAHRDSSGPRQLTRRLRSRHSVR
jgi:hypothetical protein